MEIKTDKYHQAVNCYETAIAIRQKLLKGEAIAIPLAVGHGTLYHISFIPLNKAIPQKPKVVYNDGSRRGIQINIDRKGSYSIPWDGRIGECGYLSEKWNINNRTTAQDLLPFFNTVFTGENSFVYC